MNTSSIPYTIFPLGDAAVTLDFGNIIDETINKEVIARFHQLKEDPIPGMTDAVPAYSSLTIHYDIYVVKKTNPKSETVFETVKNQLEDRLKLPLKEIVTKQRLLKIPVCYDERFATDIQQLISAKNISKEELIAIHTQKTYKVFMMGFLPGFAYMGQVDDKIAMPRKQQPEFVASGSVGIAGKQTGIYPMISPGGWHIIGRTPLKLFDTDKSEPILLQTGDTIQFYPISKTEYESY